MLNSFIIHKKKRGLMTHLNFRLAVINAIFAKYGDSTTDPGVPPRRLFNPQDNPSRLTGRHFPAHNPPTEKKKYAQKKCIVCTQRKLRKDTSIHCKTCNVALCVSPCFEVHHTLLNY